jgi:type 1 glutamine amidotransferase
MFTGFLSRRIGSWAAFSFAILLSMARLAAAGEIRVLIVTGVDYPGHLWRETTPVLEEEIGRDPRMQVSVLRDPYALRERDLAEVDTVILHFMPWERPEPGVEVKEALQRFVSRGGGLVIVHFACGAFPNWAQYEVLAGRVYDRTNTHDPRGPFTVRVPDTGHPLTRGMPASFETDDELYICLTGRTPVDVLAAARSKVTGTDQPMAVTHAYGKGRVFLTPLGHDARALRQPGAATLIRRGVAWAAGREPEADGPAPITLFPGPSGFSPAPLRTNDAAASDVGRVLHVRTGHTAPWPGVTLSPPQGTWDLTPFAMVAVSLKNIGTQSVKVFCRVDNDGADGTVHCVTDLARIEAGATCVLHVPLRRDRDGKLGDKLFGMRGYPAEAGGVGTVDPSKITQLLLFVEHPKADHAFEVSAIRAEGVWTPPTARVTDADPFFPCVDAFGQYKHRDWRGKVRSLEDLQSRNRIEQRDLENHPGAADWDRHGGWFGGPALAATGFFRVDKLRGKWWLVDPEGRLFWSHGIDCVGAMDTTPIEGRKDWFEGRPWEDPEFKECGWTGEALLGHYAGGRPECFSFAAANLRRKYGATWKADYAGVVHQRLRSWGMNTVANWSDARITALRRTPYTDTVGSSGARNIEGSEGYWGKFPDVYEPGFAAAVRRSMAGKKGGIRRGPVVHRLFFRQRDVVGRRRFARAGGPEVTGGPAGEGRFHRGIEGEVRGR